MDIYIPKFKAKERVFTRPDGKRVCVRVDDSGTTQHTETDDTLDALVRPMRTTITIKRDPQEWETSPLIRKLRGL